MSIGIDLGGATYPVPSSSADTDWAAQQVAFEQALAAGVNANTAAAATATTAAAAAVATAAAAASVAAGAASDVANVSSLSLPPDVIGSPGSGSGVDTLYGRHVVHKITIDYTQVSVPASTQTLLLWQLPPKTRVLRVIADVTEVFDGGIIAEVHTTVGDPVGAVDDFLVDFDAAVGVNVFGTFESEIGQGIVGSPAFSTDLPAWYSTLDVNAVFNSVGADLDSLIRGSVTFYVECCTYP